MARLLWSLLFSLWCLSAFSQEMSFPGEGQYWTLGVGIPVTTVRDQAHSPLAYRGMGVRFWVAHEDIRPRGLWRMEVSFQFAGLKAYVQPRQDVRRGAQLNDIQFNLGYYRRLGDGRSDLSRQYLGGRLAIRTLNRRYPLPTNNTNSLLLAPSLDIGFTDRRRLDETRWTLTSSVDVPVLAAVLRPTYIGILPFINEPDPGPGEIIRRMKLVTVNHFFHLDVRARADYARRPWRSDQLLYHWDLLYTDLPAHKPLLSTTTGLGYGYRILQ